MADYFSRKINQPEPPRDIGAFFHSPAELQSAVQAFVLAGRQSGARVAMPAAVARIAARKWAKAPAVGEGIDMAGWHPDILGNDLRQSLADLRGDAGEDCRGSWLIVEGEPCEQGWQDLRQDFTVLHLYDAAALPDAELLAALQRYPWLMVDGAISENEHYLPPAASAGTGRFAAAYERMLERRAGARAGLGSDHLMAGLVADAIALVEVVDGQPPQLLELKGTIAGQNPEQFFDPLDRLNKIHPQDLAQVVDFITRLDHSGSSEVDFRLLTGGDDSYTWVRLAGRAIPQDSSRVWYYLAARDIDWRKRTELELSASYTALTAAVTQLDQVNNLLRSQQAQLDLLLRQAPVQIWTADLNLVLSTIHGAEPAGGAGLGALETGAPLASYFAPDSQLLEAHAGALRGETAGFKLRFNERDFMARVEPLRDAAGAVVGVIGVALDITGQQQAEEALQMSQAYNRSLLNASQDSLVLLDRNGRVLAMNGSAAASLGRAEENSTGLYLSDMVPPVMGQLVLNDISSVVESGKVNQRELDTGQKVFRSRLDPIPDPQGRVAQVALQVRDVTPFLQAEQAERRRRELAEIMRSVSEDLTRATHRAEVLGVVMQGVSRLAPELSVHVMTIRDGMVSMEAFDQRPSIRALGDLNQFPEVPVNHLIDLRTMFETQQPVLIRDVTERPDWIQFGPTSWMRGYAGAPIVAGGTVVGFITVASDQPGAVNEAHVELIQSLAGQAAVALQKAQAFAALEEKNEALAVAYLELAAKNKDLAAAYDATIAGWARALELRDKETEGHSQRVVALTMRLALEMQVPQAEHQYLRWGALLHDIGKMGIPDHILLKSDQPLTEQEWVIMKLHPTLAFNMLAGIDYLRPALEIPYAHHEWWDGTGYPLALKGAAIPLAARIFSVVDAWDALTNERPYRPAWSPWRVAKHIRMLAGRQFDPQVVDKFLKLMKYD